MMSASSTVNPAGKANIKSAVHSENQPIVPKWPDALPTFFGTQFVLSLNCGNSSLAWARINDVLSCEVVWSTKPPDKVYNLYDHLPETLQREICAIPPPQPTNQSTMNNKVLCSLLRQRRKSVITVYLISSNAKHERRAIRLFDGLPVVLYKLSNKDFLEYGSVRGLSVYPSMGVDRLAAVMGAIHRFPDRISHLVIDGGTALTYTTITNNKQVGGGIGVGPRMKMSALSQLSGVQTTWNEKELDAMMEQLESSHAKLETICTTNTEQNVVGSVLKETTIHLSYVIREWRKTLPDQIPKEQTPVVILCGGDGKLFSMLLRPDHSHIFETNPDIQEFLGSGEIVENNKPWTAPKSVKAFQIVHDRSAIHAGIHHILVSQQNELVKSDVNTLRDMLVGQRVIINGKRGTIVLLKRSDSTIDFLRTDKSTVFIEAENSFVEVTLIQMVDGLDEYSKCGEVLDKKSTQTIGALNKMKDAKDILVSLAEMLRTTSVGLRIEAGIPKSQTEKGSMNEAHANIHPPNRPPLEGKSQTTQMLVPAKKPTDDRLTPEASATLAILDLVDMLMKLLKKTRLELKTLSSKDMNWVRIYLERKINGEVKSSPDFVTNMDTKAKRLAFLYSVENILAAEKPKKHTIASTQQESLSKAAAPKVGASKERAAKEGAPKEGLAKEGAPKEGLAKEGAPIEGLSKEGAPKEGLSKGGAPKEGLSKEGLSKEGAPKERAPKERALKEGLSKEGSSREKANIGDSAPKEGVSKEGAPKDRAQKETVLPEEIVNLRAPKERAQNEETLNVSAPKVGNMDEGASNHTRDPPLSTKKDKKRKRDTLVSKKEGYVGHRVAKYFTDHSGKNKLYAGRVACYFPSEEVESGTELWQIRFDDGDEEDVEEAELYVILDLYKRNRMMFLQKS